jgi:hypothetical protein
VIETLRGRDGRVPEWVETATPVGAASPPAQEEQGERESGDQLTLSL